MKSKKNQKGEKIKEMQEYKIVKNNYKGITLIALVITIVLLILTSVSIAMLTGDNGILTRAGDAKIETALGAVKEQIGLYQIEKKMDNKEVTPESLLAEGKVSRTVQAGEADKYYMYYVLKENSFEGMQELGKGNIASLKDVFLIDDNLNIKYISSDGKEYGDNLNNKVLEDEMKFKRMKNQKTLVISDQNVDSLQDLVFFPNLTSLFLEKLTLENLNGVENCKILQYVATSNCKIEDFSEIGYLQNLKELYNYGKVNMDDLIDGLNKCNNLKTLTITAAQIDNMERVRE